MVKRDCLLTNQPCESTVTAVGEVKVLVLHGAREWLADYRSPLAVAGRDKELADILAAARKEEAGLKEEPKEEAGRKEEAGLKAPSDPLTANLRQRRVVSHAPR